MLPSLIELPPCISFILNSFDPTFRLTRLLTHLPTAYSQPTVDFKALQIFVEDVHPLVVKGVQRGKEGFSLFGLFDRTKSAPGKQVKRRWRVRRNWML